MEPLGRRATQATCGRSGFSRIRSNSTRRALRRNHFNTTVVAYGDAAIISSAFLDNPAFAGLREFLTSALHISSEVGSNPSRVDFESSPATVVDEDRDVATST